MKPMHYFIAKIRKLANTKFYEYVVYIEPDIPDTIKIKPLVIVKDKSQKWF